MVVVGCVGLIAISEWTSTMDKFVPIFGSKEFSTFIVSATAGSFAIELVYLILAFAAFGLLPARRYLVAVPDRRDRRGHPDPRLLRRARPGAARR